MHKARNTLLSIGVAIAGTKLVQAMSGLEFNDLIRPLGLARRRGNWPEHLLLLGAGVLVGGATALLLAPSSGRVARERIATKVDELGAAASRKVREYGFDMGQDADAERGNGDSPQFSPPR